MLASFGEKLKSWQTATIVLDFESVLPFVTFISNETYRSTLKLVLRLIFTVSLRDVSGFNDFMRVLCYLRIAAATRYHYLKKYKKMEKMTHKRGERPW